MLDVLTAENQQLRSNGDLLLMAAIAIVAGGYGRDMSEEQCYDLLDDMDFYYNKPQIRNL